MSARFVSSDQLLRSLDESAMSWGDIDDDGDDDLAIMGKNRSGDAQTLVYFNRNGVADPGSRRRPATPAKRRCRLGRLRQRR